MNIMLNSLDSDSKVFHILYVHIIQNTVRRIEFGEFFRAHTISCYSHFRLLSESCLDIIL